MSSDATITAGGPADSTVPRPSARTGLPAATAAAALSRVTRSPSGLIAVVAVTRTTVPLARVRAPAAASTDATDIPNSTELPDAWPAPPSAGPRRLRPFTVIERPSTRSTAAEVPSTLTKLSPST